MDDDQTFFYRVGERLPFFHNVCCYLCVECVRVHFLVERNRSNRYYLRRFRLSYQCFGDAPGWIVVW